MMDTSRTNMISSPEGQSHRKAGKAKGGIVSMKETNEEVRRTEEVQETYQAPKVLAIGKAVDLLQGATGKHTDGSTGYYWDQEG
jgi:hypothetical protein